MFSRFDTFVECQTDTFPQNRFGTEGGNMMSKDNPMSLVLPQKRLLESICNSIYSTMDWRHIQQFVFFTIATVTILRLSTQSGLYEGESLCNLKNNI